MTIYSILQTKPKQLPSFNSLVNFARNQLQRNSGSSLKLRSKRAPIPAYMIKPMMDKQNGRCYWCNKKIRDKAFEVDHYIPVVLGGINTIENYSLTCRRCNRRKSAMMPLDYAKKINKLEAPERTERLLKQIHEGTGRTGYIPTFYFSLERCTGVSVVLIKGFSNEFFNLIKSTISDSERQFIKLRQGGTMYRGYAFNETSLDILTEAFKKHEDLYIIE